MRAILLLSVALNMRAFQLENRQAYNSMSAAISSSAVGSSSGIDGGGALTPMPYATSSPSFNLADSFSHHAHHYAHLQHQHQQQEQSYAWPSPHFAITDPASTAAAAAAFPSPLMPQYFTTPPFGGGDGRNDASGGDSSGLGRSDCKS